MGLQRLEERRGKELAKKIDELKHHAASISHKYPY